MKNFNFLTNLFSPSAGLQSSDVSVDRRFTVGSPSGFNSKLMLKLVSVLVLILTIGSGNVWGANYNQMTPGTDALSNGDEVLIAIQDRKAGKFYFVQCGSTKYLEQTVTAGVVSDPAATTIWVATESSGNWIFRKKDAASNGYLYNSGSNTTLATDNMTFATWYVSNGSSGSPAYKYFKMQQGGSSGRYISWSGSTFAAYSNSNWSSKGVQPANSNLVQYNGALQIFKKATATTHTVRFYTASDTYTDLTEASAGAGVTPPTMSTPCDGWTFQGWSKSQSTSSTSTTVLSTETLSAGKYYPSSDVTLYPVYTKKEGGGTTWTKMTTNPVAGDVVILVSEGSTVEGKDKTQTKYITTQTYTEAPAGLLPFTVEAGSPSGLSFKNGSDYLQYNGSNNELNHSTTKDNKSSWTVYVAANGTATITNVASTSRVIKYNSGSPRFACYTSGQQSIQLYKQTAATTTYYYSYPTCCTDPELNYATGSVTKTYGEGAFTNALTNSPSVAVTYSSSDPTVATVNGSGQVTILKAGSTTITASSIAQTVAAVSYCADEASYTLTVNKASISPTLTYDPNSVAVGENTSAPTVGGNTGGGGVTYAITSASPSGCATINTSTGVVTGVAVGFVTVTATVAATTNYNGGSATATVTITAASGYCISAFNSSNNGITSGFSNGGSGNEYTLNYTIPGKDGSSNWPQYWIGENEAWASFSANALFADMHFTHSDATLGLAEGATGKLHIWDDNKASGSNLWVKFEPDGYGFRWGGAGEWDQAANTKAFTVDPGNANTYWTEIVTLDGTNNTTWNYYVGLQSASGYVYSGVDNEASDSRGISRTRSVTTMKVSNGTAGSYKATYLNSEATGTRGKFRIWDNNISDHNFVCHFVPYYRITYNGSGASGSTDPSADVSCEGDDAARTVVAAANGFTVPTGKSFGGWASSPENAAAGVVAYAAGANVVLTSSITLYAIWTDINYTVTMEQSPAAGATLTGGTTTANYGGTINISTNVPSGYRFNGWTASPSVTFANASATTTSFTMPAGNVTVTANFQQTHTVDWYVGGSAVGNKLGDDGQTTVVDHGGKIEDFPATTPDGTPCDKTFVGWTNTTSYTHGTSLLFDDVAGSPTITGATNFYAVFAEDGGSSYVLVESDLGTDWAGDYLIAYSSTVFADGRVGGTGTGGMGKQYQKANPGDKLDGKVVDVDWGDTYHIILEEVSSNSNTYLLKTQDGLYNYVSSNSNGLSTTSTRATAALYPITVTFTSSSDVRLGLGGNAAGAVFRYNASEYFRYYTNCTQNAVYLYKKTGGYTGHTINCADCGTSVTPTFTAAPTGGTVAVTKGGNAVTSGSTVKTCTSQELSVTITPATHYTLTGFTASGLTTGTATISPTVGSVLPTASAQTFTVTVSASATGTLNLTPVFTAETPLTITLSTNGKGTYSDPAEWPIYSGESFTLPSVTPNDPSCATFVGWIQGTTFPGDGSTHDAPVTISAGSSSGALSVNTTYTAVFYETETTETDAYVKVTSAPADWSGDYLIVRESGGYYYAFDGSLSTLDASGNYVDVSATDGVIIATNALAANKWTIAKIGETTNYSIKSASGYYIGCTGTGNGLNSSTSTVYTNTLAYSTDHTVITSSGGPVLQTYNSSRFRYYASSQGAIQLYKLGTAEAETRTYTTDPACTVKYRVTVASVTGGSPSADPKFNPESTTVTITANPSAGYSFTSWTITKTTGGDNVTSTLLTGDKPTTANTTFTMPAYDITIAATYTKKMVSTLEVKDGATVVSTTTGPVSGTVNISTGANKTLNVVITPSDAYDHSWTATVSAGSTYASITNVTDDGFRVNGLAQGDATITVNAPNDGSAKSVTLTVQVRDIMPEEIILKRDGSNTPIETLIMYYDETNSKGQYVKVNVGYSPANPTNKAFTFSSAATGKVGSHSHAPASGYEVLVANGVTSDAVNCTFTSSADGSVTKVLAVTVLPILSDRFVDYVHGNATQTVSARLSDDRYSIIPDINTPSLSDASDANPTSEDCETSHYHLVGWLPQTTAEALWAAGTPITDATEGLVRAGESVEATGQTWCAIWAKEE